MYEGYLWNINEFDFETHTLQGKFRYTGRIQSKVSPTLSFSSFNFWFPRENYKNLKHAICEELFLDRN